MSTGAAVRLAHPADAAGMLAIYAPIVERTVISFETVVPSVDEMRGRISATMAIHPWLVAERAGRIIGYAYGSQHRSRAAYRWAADVSVYVAEGARRNGMARQLYGGLFELLTRQGYSACCAGIALPNPASVGFHESQGFRPVGVYRRIGWKLGAWHDVGWWQKELQPIGDANGQPPEPRPLAELLAGAGGELTLRGGTQGPGSTPTA